MGQEKFVADVKLEEFLKGQPERIRNLRDELNIAFKGEVEKHSKESRRYGIIEGALIAASAILFVGSLLFFVWVIL